MAGFIATLQLGSQPASFDSPGKNIASQQHRATEGTHEWRSAKACFVSFLSRHDQSEHYEGRTGSDHSIVVSFDGVIDNSAQLRSLLKLNDDVPDAELVGRAYERWDCESFSRLIGIFSFVIWDGQQQTLLCVRDVIGMKPVHYFHQPGDKFVCASEVAGVLANERVPRETNERYMAEWVVGRLSSTTDTPYSAVQRLPPAHYLKVSQDSFEVRKYFKFDLGAEIRCGTDQEYFDHFEQLFSDVVASQASMEGKVAVGLSGGLDSSSVAGVMGRLIQQSKLASPLITLSQIYPGRTCDERDHMESVEQFWGAQSHYIDPFDYKLFAFQNQIQRHRDLPYAAHYSTVVATHSLAQSQGIRTLLTGFGSDELFHGSSEHWRDVLRSGRLRSLRQTRRSYGQPESRNLSRRLLKNLLEPFVPSAVRWRRILRAQASRSDYLTQRLINEVASFEPGDEWKAPHPIGSFANYAQRDIYCTLFAPWCTRVLELQERMATSFGIMLRHPFLDRRIVQFALSIPEHLRWRDENRKFVVRESLRSVLPPSVLARNSKTDFAEVQYEAVIRAANETTATNGKSIECPQLASRGWVDAERLEADFSRMRMFKKADDPRFGDLAWPLWRALSAELFLANQQTTDSTEFSKR